MSRHAVVAALPLLVASRALAQAGCTDQQAYAHAGTWQPAGSVSYASADAATRKTTTTAAIAQADQIRALLVRAIPNVSGIDAKAYDWIGGRAGASGPLTYGVNALFKGYSCVPNPPSYVAAVRGQVRLGDETGTWIYLSVNTLYWLINDFAAAGLRSTAGQTIYYFPHQGGEWHGLPVLLPQVHRDQKPEAYIVAPDGRLPYKFINEEEYLQAIAGHMDSLLTAYRKLPGAARLVADQQSDLDQTRAAIAALSAADRQAVAEVRNAYTLPWRQRPSRNGPAPSFFTPQATGGRRLFVVNAQFFDPKLPAAAVQFVTIYVRWDATPPKQSIAQQFKDHFDLAALRALLQ